MKRDARKRGRGGGKGLHRVAAAAGAGAGAAPRASRGRPAAAPAPTSLRAREMRVAGAPPDRRDAASAGPAAGVRAVLLPSLHACRG